MATATVTSKGQITIPVQVRSALGVDAGDRIEFVEIEKGQFAIVAATRSVHELKGLFHGRRKRLEYKWNLIRPFFRDPPVLPLTEAELKKALQDAKIIHFNGSLKPWSYFSDHPRKGEYQKYLRMTEWRDYVPPDRTPLNILRKGVSSMLPHPLKDAFRTVKAHLSG